MNYYIHKNRNQLNIEKYIDNVTKRLLIITDIMRILFLSLENENVGIVDEL